MNKRVRFLLATLLLALPAWAMAQSDQTYATYITEEQWQMVNVYRTRFLGHTFALRGMA